MKEFLIRLVNFVDWMVDYILDTCLGIETLKSIKIKDLGLNEFYQEHARPYQGTRSRIITNIFRKFAPHLPATGVFMDVGCGKGRVLIYANKLLRPKKMIGVDISEKLIQLCRTNLQKLQLPCELINADVLKLANWQEVDVVYFFNPFDSKILRELIKKWEFYTLPGKELYIIYVNPIRGHFLEMHPWIRPLQKMDAFNYNNRATLYIFKHPLNIEKLKNPMEIISQMGQ